MTFLSHAAANSVGILLLIGVLHLCGYRITITRRPNRRRP